MELGSKVAALEEEITILKGEIKTILQEVRTAVLARENPFAADAHENLHIPPSSVPEPAPLAAEPEPEAPSPITPLTATPSTDNEQRAENPAGEANAPRQLVSDERVGRRWSVSGLAALMSWTQETASRMDASDLDIVLSLAHYGGLVDEELVTTLTKLSAPLFESNQDAEARPRGVSDYLLALRELAAILEDAGESARGFAPVRKAS